MSDTDIKVQAKNSGPGAVLAAAREEIGVSQREVAEALNLPINVVDAIEVGDNSRLPSHVFTRGYVRAYAKLLEIDADPLVAALVLEHEEQVVPQTTPRKLVNLATLQALNPQIVIGAGAALLVLLILIGVFASGSDEPESQTQQASQSADQQTDQKTDQQTQQQTAARQQQQVASAAVLPTGEATSEEVVSGVQGEAAAVTQVSLAQGDLVEQDEAVAPTPGVRRLTPEGVDRLSFLFAEDCWVSIKGAQGAVLYGDLGKAGQTLEFIGAAPFTVLLGYAQGVILKYNSEPIALAPHTRNNVATLVLGQ